MLLFLSFYDRNMIFKCLNTIKYTHAHTPAQSESHKQTEKLCADLCVCVCVCGINLKEQLCFALTCASVATTKPNVKAICTMDGSYPVFHADVVLAMPTDTKKNVPKNSASKIFHIFRLFMMSLTPMIRFTPEINNEFNQIDSHEYFAILVCTRQFRNNYQFQLVGFYLQKHNAKHLSETQLEYRQNSHFAKAKLKFTIDSSQCRCRLL